MFGKMKSANNDFIINAGRAAGNLKKAKAGPPNRKGSGSRFNKKQALPAKKVMMSKGQKVETQLARGPFADRKRDLRHSLGKSGTFKTPADRN